MSWRLSPWIEISLAIVLIFFAVFFIWKMVGDISDGRILTYTTRELWLWAIPVLAPLILLSLLLLRQVNRSWVRRLGSIRPDLRRRLAQTFAIVGLAPTLLILLLAIAYFNIGFSGWINKTFDRVLSDQTALAEGYSLDLKNRIGDSIGSIGQDVSAILEEGGGLSTIENFFQERASVGSYWHLYLYDATGSPVLRFGPGQNFDPIIPGSAFREASQSLNGRLNLTSQEGFKQVKALAVVPQTVPPVFVYGSQLVDSAFTESADSAREARAQLSSIEVRLRLTFFIVSSSLIAVALVLLFGATALGLWFANRLLEPIGNIIAAAKVMGEGALDARVPISDRQFAEFRELSLSFNFMAGQLENQQADLRSANEQIKQRSQFTTAVLTGVSAGVLGLDANFCLTLPNKAASDLLGIDLSKSHGEDVRVLLPEFAGLLEQAAQKRGTVRSREVKIFHRSTGSLLVLLASAVSERTDGEVIGFVLTFDDISELASAQRQSAWSEVARRIAHEIKNPLTPIQLSTERLKRRFSKDVPDEGREVFNLCLDTISKQVDTISRLVNEFSSFSRLPTATLAKMDLAQAVRQAHFLQAARFEAQDWVVTVPENAVWINGDSTLINQAVQNLIKNAGEAARGSSGGDLPSVFISLSVNKINQAVLVIADNGHGFAEELLSKIGEPYVSTKEGGTGLGLAIVKKIMEDHGAAFSPRNRKSGGAEISLTFPLYKIK